MNLKIITFAVCAALLCLPCFAQKGNGPGMYGRQGQRMGAAGQGLMRTLNLTDEQKSKIQDILKNSRTSRRSIMQSNASQEEKTKQLKALSKKNVAEIKKILTKEQIAKAKESGIFNRMLNGRGAGSALIPIMNQLNLTADQKKAIRDINQDSMKQMQSIRSDSSLNKDQKSTKIKELMKSERKKINNLLTAEQKSKLKTIIEKNRPAKKQQSS